MPSPLASETEERLDEELEQGLEEGLNQEEGLEQEESLEQDPEASEESAEGEPTEELVFKLKGEKPEEAPAVKAPAPKWVKDLRKEREELRRKVTELEAKVNSTGAQTTELRPRPKLEEFGYDEAKWVEANDAWLEEKRVKIDEPQQKAKREQEAAERDWKEKQAKYNADKTKLKVKNFEEAESNVREALSDVQQGLLLDGADKPEIAVYILGMRPKLLEELAAIKSPAKFAARIGRLEADLMIEKRAGTPSAPEDRAPRSAGTVMGKNGIQRKIDELEAKFDKGLLRDRSEIVRLKSELKKSLTR
jgi:hypothetical protein